MGFPIGLPTEPTEQKSPATEKWPGVCRGEIMFNHRLQEERVTIECRPPPFKNVTDQKELYQETL